MQKDEKRESLEEENEAATNSLLEIKMVGAQVEETFFWPNWTR